MTLTHYGVKITLFDPDDPETQISITLDRVPRENILTVKVPLDGALQELEASIDE